MNAQPASIKTYAFVWGALLLLLLLTWGCARVDIGVFNTLAALGIAFAKMLLVLLFFMHVRHEKKLIWIFVAAGILWFAIMVDLTLSDYLGRGQVQQTDLRRDLPLGNRR